MPGEKLVREGVQWPLQPDGGAVSTTRTGKAIWRAAALAAGSPELAAAIDAEKDWRWRYADHVVALAELMARSRERSLAGARAGLAALEAAFELVPPGGGAAPLPLYRTLRERAAEGPSSAFGAIAVRSGRAACVPSVALPGIDPLFLFQKWAAHGVCEPSALESVSALLREERSGGGASLPALLHSHVFVCLGGTSEMCPARTLLALGATVVAVARKGSKLQALIAYARGQQPAADGSGAGEEGGLCAAPPAGTLIVPVPLAAAEAAAGAGSGPAFEQALREAGADMLVEAAEIAAWLAALDMPPPPLPSSSSSSSGAAGAAQGAARDGAIVAEATAAAAAAAASALGVAPPSPPPRAGADGHHGVLVLGSYGYLDGADHVRLGAAMDAITCAVLAARPPGATAVAYLASPSTATIVPAEARDAAAARYEACGALSLRWLRTPNARAAVCAEDACSDRRGRFVCNGLVNMQGPNYALAKSAQQWRAALLAHEGRCARVSSLFAPGARTASMVHVPSLGAALHGLEAFEPLHVPQVAVCAYAMALLLLRSLCEPQVRARARAAPAPPLPCLGSALPTPRALTRACRPCSRHRFPLPCRRCRRCCVRSGRLCGRWARALRGARRYVALRFHRRVDWLVGFPPRPARLSRKAAARAPGCNAAAAIALSASEPLAANFCIALSAAVIVVSTTNKQ